MTRKHSRRRPPWAVGSGVAALLGLSLVAGGARLAAAPSLTEPRPTPPPAVWRQRSAPAPPPARRASSAAVQPVPYTIGNPTDEEQLFVELINWGRANPAAEGQAFLTTTDPDVVGNYDFFHVDLGVMAAQFALLPPAPPLSLNAALTAAARGHSADMLTNAFQGHNGTDGSTFEDRITAQGYVWGAVAENVFAYGKSVWESHAGFDVDWGNGTNGMQTPPGHRINLHNPVYHEIGVGVVHGTNGPVGPLLVTEDFASTFNPPAFVTGVAYYDLNTNAFYDLGEGLSGVQVRVAGAGFFAVTTNSGGYSVPVPGDGTYAVTFSAPGLPDHPTTVTVTNGQNVKLDYAPPYTAPRVTGPPVAPLGQTTFYQFSAVGAAQAYQWRQVQRLATNVVETGDGGLGDFTVVVSSGYTVLASDPSLGNGQFFHLVQPLPAPQTLQLNLALYPGTNATVGFLSRLGWASTGQVARAQISLDQGASWRDLWSQTGDGGRGQATFQPQGLSLAPFAGNEVRLRFVYDFLGPFFFNQTTTDVGWALQNITVAGADVLLAPVIGAVTETNSFAFTPAVAGNYLLQVRPMISGHYLDWGPRAPVAAAAGVPPTARVKILSVQLGGGNQVRFSFVVLSGTASQYHLESAPTPAGAWTTDAGAVVTAAEASQFNVTTALAPAARRYYRIRGD